MLFNSINILLVSKNCQLFTYLFRNMFKINKKKSFSEIFIDINAPKCIENIANRTKRKKYIFSVLLKAALNKNALAARKNVHSIFISNNKQCMLSTRRYVQHTPFFHLCPSQLCWHDLIIVRANSKLC